MKVLAGDFHDYKGNISFNRDVINLNTPIKALQYGINCVHQEVDQILIPDFTVKENLLLYERVLGQEKGWVNQKRMRIKAEKILEETVQANDIDPDDYVRNLKVHQKQVIIIARAISFGGKFILFDEPTTSLDLKDIKKLFQLIRMLLDNKTGIVYVSHHLREIFEISDRITVMRNGKRTLTESTKDLNENDIIQAIVGGKGGYVEVRAPERAFKKSDTPLLEVRKLRKHKYLRECSFNLEKGEILGVYGQVGAGKTELARLLFGLEQKDGGEVFIEGVKADFAHPSDAISSKVFMVNEDRRGQGLLVENSIKFNTSLPTLSLYSKYLGIVDRTREEKKINEIIKDLDVKCSGVDQFVYTLSGGNQQKIAIGKWLAFPERSIFIFDEPTKGIDIGAKAKIYSIVVEMAKQGIGIIYISNEVEEILALSHRIIVMYDKEISVEIPNDKISEEQLLSWSMSPNED